MGEPRFTRRSLGVGLGLIAFGVIVALLPTVVMAITPHFMATEYDDPQLVPDFTLPRADGGTFRLSETRGQVVVMYFGYTSCPDVCPTTLFDLHRAMESLGEAAQDVTVVFVTVDPATDTQEKMADYLRYFDERFIGLVGAPEQLQPVYDRFGVQVLRSEETAGGYGLGHTTSAFVVDRAGQLRLRVHYGTQPDKIADDLRILLREKAT